MKAAKTYIADIRWRDDSGLCQKKLVIEATSLKSAKENAKHYANSFGLWFMGIAEQKEVL